MRGCWTGDCGRAGEPRTRDDSETAIRVELGEHPLQLLPHLVDTGPVAAQLRTVEHPVPTTTDP